VALPLLEEAPEVAEPVLTCTEEGCGREFRTKALLGVHRWNAHKLRAPKGASHHKAAAAKKAAPRKEAAPRPTPERKTPRKDGSGICGGAWEIAAELFVPSVSPAAAVAMAWQAEAAGPVLDKAVAGTVVDKVVVQRIAGKGEDARDLGALLFLPLAMMAFERNPALAANERIRKLFRRVVRANFEAIADARIKERKQEARWQAKAIEAGIPIAVIDEAGHEVDAIDAMVNDLLSLIPAVAEASA
jgi:hypothetical protein